MDDKKIEWVGWLGIGLGPMFSGKTTFLCSKLNHFSDIGLSTLYVNSTKDKRNTEIFSTHNSGGRLSSKVLRKKVDSLTDIDSFIKEYESDNENGPRRIHVIGIDESQWFSDLLPIVAKWVNDEGRGLICVGLDGDFQMRPFGDILKLIPICNWVEKLMAKCGKCLDDNKLTNFQVDLTSMDAPFTGKLSRSQEQSEAGGSELYIALCRRHHKEHLSN